MQEIIINKDKQSNIIVAINENGVLIEKYQEVNNRSRLEGNIYIGKIENVLSGMQAAFVNIGEGKNAFIHLQDILPKVDITKNEKVDLSEKDIKEVVKPGMKILVQVKRDCINKKGARVSSHISIVSRYLVLMPETEIVTISQKIENKTEQERLLNIVKNNLPKNMGAIVRTLAEGKEEKELINDLNKVIKRWDKIKETSKNVEEPFLIEKNVGLVKKILIDIMDENISKIIVNDEEIYNDVKRIIEEFEYEDKVKLELRNEEDILHIYDINSQIEKTENRKIWLKCGGFITIDKTEALTAIDVNSGKFVGNKNLEDTVFTVNKEASKEIAKQLKLRDIGGIIVIDYIDMNKDENKKMIIKILENELKSDRSKTQILEFTKLNLLEMTRKHMFSNE